MNVERIKEKIDKVVKDIANEFAALHLYIDYGKDGPKCIDSLIIDPDKFSRIEKEVVAALIPSKEDWDMAANAIDKFNEQLKIFIDDK